MEVRPRRPQGGEVEAPPRRHSLLQRGRKEEAHNPRRYLLGQRESSARLQLLQQGGGEQDEIHTRLLRREEVEVALENPWRLCAEGGPFGASFFVLNTIGRGF